MRIGITGSTGLIGTALGHHVRRGGHETVAIVRGDAAPGEILWEPSAGRLEADDLLGLDAIVHLAGANIGGQRWTDEYKRVLVDSRIQGTTLIAERIAATIGDGGPTVLLSASGADYYPDDGASHDESSPPGSGFLADLCLAWEASTGAAAQAGARVVHLRSTMVLSPAGGALARMLPFFKIGLGGRFGSGRQLQSWISIDDEVRAIAHLLGSGVSGPVNMASPDTVDNAEFTKVLGAVLGRPTLLLIPRFGPKLLYGSELVDALLFSSRRIVPRRLLDDGFAFEHPRLETALRAVLGR